MILSFHQLEKGILSRLEIVLHKKIRKTPTMIAGSSTKSQKETKFKKKMKTKSSKRDRPIVNEVLLASVLGKGETRKGNLTRRCLLQVGAQEKNTKKSLRPITPSTAKEATKFRSRGGTNGKRTGKRGQDSVMFGRGSIRRGLCCEDGALLDGQ